MAFAANSATGVLASFLLLTAGMGTIGVVSMRRTAQMATPDRALAPAVA